LIEAIAHGGYRLGYERFTVLVKSGADFPRRRDFASGQVLASIGKPNLHLREIVERRAQAIPPRRDLLAVRGREEQLIVSSKSTLDEIIDALVRRVVAIELALVRVNDEDNLPPADQDRDGVGVGRAKRRGPQD
jgi:hypothetical protein